MKTKIENYYQNLILQDIQNPHYPGFRKIFPWVLVGFFALQVYYFFWLFHPRIWLIISYIRFFHSQKYLNVPPKAVMFAYDELILFLAFLAFVLALAVLSFIFFDYSQRAKIIRRLLNSQPK